MLVFRDRILLPSIVPKCAFAFSNSTVIMIPIGCKVVSIYLYANILSVSENLICVVDPDWLSEAAPA